MDLYREDKFGDTACETAEINGHRDIMNYLINHEAHHGPCQGSNIKRQNTRKKVKKVCRKGTPMNFIGGLL